MWLVLVSLDSSFEYTDSTGTDLQEFIIKTLKNPRCVALLCRAGVVWCNDTREFLKGNPPRRAISTKTSTHDKKLSLVFELEF